MKKLSRPKRQNRMAHVKRVEHDLAYWLEHVVHWFLLLVVIASAVTFGVTLM